MFDLYCILPSGNSSSFEQIDENLKSLDIQYRVKKLSSGGRIYCISGGSVEKLPIDNKTHEPYLPTTADRLSGQSLYTQDPFHDFDGEWSKSNLFDNL